MKDHYDNRFIFPGKNILGRILNLILNSSTLVKIKRFFFYPFTKIDLRSDVTNVVYLNWLVPQARIEHLIPKQVKLTMYEGKVLFTVLTFKHGHFRPAFFRNAKRIF